jgi:hypothetical protein
MLPYVPAKAKLLCEEKRNYPYTVELHSALRLSLVKELNAFRGWISTAILEYTNVRVTGTGGTDSKCCLQMLVLPVPVIRTVNVVFCGTG